MGLVRLALIAAAIVVALLLIKRLLGGRPAQNSPAAKPATPRLVQCAHCGVHVGEAEAIRSGDHYYCSTDHQQRGESR